MTLVGLLVASGGILGGQLFGTDFPTSRGEGKGPFDHLGRVAPLSQGAVLKASSGWHAVQCSALDGDMQRMFFRTQ